MRVYDITLLLAACLAVMLWGCFRVAPPPDAPTTQAPGGSTWVNSYLWGILVDDAEVACPYGGMAQIDAAAVVPVSVLTVGIVTPMRVSWTCELPRRRLEDENAFP
jgi:hypothetical protein